MAKLDVVSDDIGGESPGFVSAGIQVPLKI